MRRKPITEPQLVEEDYEKEESFVCDACDERFSSDDPAYKVVVEIIEYGHARRETHFYHKGCL